jgi:hypothetical protein
LSPREDHPYPGAAGFFDREFPMKRILTVITTGGVILLGSQALAVESMSQSKLDKRHLVECMTKRMSNDRTLSYIAAGKACKDQLKLQSENAAGTPLQAGNTR